MAKYKVVVTARSFGNTDEKAYRILEENDCEVKKIKAEDISTEIVDADAVIAGLEEYNEELISKAEKLKVISRYGVGYDKVDLETCKKHNVAVTFTPGANSESVADMAVCLMLACARNITEINSRLKKGESYRPAGVELFGKTLGIIGAGRIGKGVGKRCSGFNMNILCYDTYEDENFKKEYGAKYVSLEELLKESDFITIHSPLTPETRNMISTKELSLMKEDAIIVNTARGGIIDEEALYKALTEHRIRAAGLDVLEKDPSFESPLCELDNCIVTSHVAATTKEASSLMSTMAAENVVDILTTGTSRNKVV